MEFNIWNRFVRRATLKTEIYSAINREGEKIYTFKCNGVLTEKSARVRFRPIDNAFHLLCTIRYNHANGAWHNRGVR